MNKAKENTIIVLYKSLGESSRSVAKKVDLGKTTILRVLRRNNVCPKNEKQVINKTWRFMGIPLEPKEPPFLRE